jgi:molybdopterin-guanine dinucleotide biosynthesis protein A
MTTPSRDAVTGVILCGGEGRRMGGVEKPLALVHGMPMVQHVRERLAPQVYRVLMSANARHDEYGQWGDEVIADDDGSSAAADASRGGPLFGIRAALRAVQRDAAARDGARGDELLFCCPGDAPRLATTLVARLHDALIANDAMVAYPHDGEQPQGLFVLLRVTDAMSASLEQYLQRGERSVHGWLSAIHAVAVEARDLADSFVNINTSRELLALGAPA